MLELLLFTLRGQRRSLVLYALLPLAYSAMVMVLYPSAQRLLSSGQPTESLPLPVQLLLGGGARPAPVSAETWLASQYFQSVWIALLGAFAIGYGSAALAQEIENGTISLLLSAPVSRRAIVLSRFAALSLGLLVLVIATAGGTLLGASLAGVALDLWRLLPTMLLGYAFALTIGAYLLLMSAVTSDRSTASLLALGITGLFYLAHFLSSYWPAARGLSFLTLFSLYSPVAAITSGQVPWSEVLVMLGQAVLYSLLGAELFRQRDLLL